MLTQVTELVCVEELESFTIDFNKRQLDILFWNTVSKVDVLFALPKTVGFRSQPVGCSQLVD